MHHKNPQNNFFFNLHLSWLDQSQHCYSSDKLTIDGNPYYICYMQVVTRTLLNSGFSGPVKEICRQLYKEFAGPQRWEVFPDVPKALQQLRSNGVVLGVVSNFDERLGKLAMMSMHFHARSFESDLSMTE